MHGRAVGNAALIEALNEIGSTHGIGRTDIVENRLIGMKSRGLDEAPGATILRAAHQALEEITLDRETMIDKQVIALKYADLVYNGQWVHRCRAALQAFVTVTQRDVSGSVRVRLFRAWHGCAAQLPRVSPLYPARIPWPRSTTTPRIPMMRRRRLYQAPYACPCV